MSRFEGMTFGDDSTGRSITQAFEHIDDSVDVLSGLIDELEFRLKPVLRPRDSDYAPPDGVEMPGSDSESEPAPFARELGYEGNRIACENRGLHDIINRLELDCEEEKG